MDMNVGHLCKYYYIVCTLQNIKNIVVHSGDHKGVGMAHKIALPKTQLQMTGKTKLKSDPKCLVATEF